MSPAARHPRLWPKPPPSLPRCLSAAGLYGPSCNAAFGFGLILRIFWPRCLSAAGLYDTSSPAAFGFGGSHGPRGLPACQPSSSMSPAVRHPRLWPTPPPLLPRCLSAAGLYGPSCNAALGFGLILRLFWPRCLSAAGLYGPRFTAAYGYRFILRPSWPRCLSAAGLYGPVAPQPSAAALFYGHRGLAACQPPDYTAPAATQPLASA